MANTFPDGLDRTPNDPCLLLSASSVRRLYEDKCGSERDGNPSMTPAKLLEFVNEQVTENNWDGFSFHGKQLILRKNFLEHRSSTDKTEPPTFQISVVGDAGSGMTREKLFASAMMSPATMQTEDLFRQSGRTSRMLADAVKTAKAGEPVVIVMKDTMQEGRVAAAVKDIQGIVVIHYNHRKPNVDWETLQAIAYPQHKTFIDHDVIYFNHLALFRACSKYDPKFNIEGDRMTFVNDRVDQ